MVMKQRFIILFEVHCCGASTALKIGTFPESGSVERTMWRTGKLSVLTFIYLHQTHILQQNLARSLLGNSPNTNCKPTLPKHANSKIQKMHSFCTREVSFISQYYKLRKPPDLTRILLPLLLLSLSIIKPTWPQVWWRPRSFRRPFYPLRKPGRLGKQEVLRG